MYHTQTRIYSTSLELVEIARIVIDRLPSGYGFLADQLRRAAASVTLNYMEGCGRRSARDRRRFLDMARASAYEVCAVLDVALRFRVVDDELARQGKSCCDQLAGMLSRFR